MRLHEFFDEEVDEAIEKLRPSDYPSDLAFSKYTIRKYEMPENAKPLYPNDPSSTLLWSMQIGDGGNNPLLSSLVDIFIWDQALRNSERDKRVAKLSLKMRARETFPIKAAQVDTIAARPGYTNRGLGKALYNLALRELKVPILAGDEQTPDGRRAWVKMTTIPEVKVYGWVAFDDSAIRLDRKQRTTRDMTDDYKIDKLSRMVKGSYFGKTDRSFFFLFDVQSSQKGNHLIPVYRHPYLSVYGDRAGAYPNGLMAIIPGVTTIQAF